MTALLVILVLLGLLLLTPVGISAAYSPEGLRADVRIGWLRMHVYPGKKTAPAHKKKKKIAKRKKTEKKTDEKEDEKPEKKKRPLSYYLALAKIGLRAAKLFLKGIAVDRLCAAVTVAGTDAAKTALLYGRLSAAEGTLHALLDNSLNLKHYEVSLGADFTAEKTRIEGEAALSFLLYSVFGAAFCFLFAFIKMKRKEKSADLDHGGDYERSEGTSDR